MDRFWFLTSTTYGTWLPGDGRGSVTDLRDELWQKYCPNEPGTDYAPEIAGLRRFAEDQLKCPPIWFTKDHAGLLVPQFRETAAYRNWALFAVAVMGNHVHLVVGVPGDPDPSDVLRDFKSYGSRPLNRRWGKPASGTWWTEGGSKRKLANRTGVFKAARYTRDQHNALAVWMNADTIRGHLEPAHANKLLEGERGA